MGKKRKHSNMTQEEIWDDSTLLRSWQDAFDEYQLYHSIHAKGGNVEDILRLRQQAGNAKDDEDDGVDGDYRQNDVTDRVGTFAELENGSEMEDGEVDEDEGVETITPAAALTSQAHATTEDSRLDTASHSAADTKGYGTGVDASASVVDTDQTLANVKMAYWWAGYYSGLYEAQQTGHATDRQERDKAV